MPADFKSSRIWNDRLGDQRFGCDRLPRWRPALLWLTSIFCSSANYIVRHQRPSDPFQLEITNRLDLPGVLDLLSTRALIRICPGLGSSNSREATLDTVPMAGIVEASLEAEPLHRDRRS